MITYNKEKASYAMEALPADKVLHLSASGFFSEEDGTSFLKDYDAVVKTVPTKDYALVIDAPDLMPSSPKVADMLGELLKRYIEVPFKKRFLVTKGNVIAIMQFKRLGAGIPGWTESIVYVDDYPAALAAAKK